VASNCPPDRDITYKKFDLLSNNFSVARVSDFIAKKLIVQSDCALCRDSLTTAISHAQLHCGIPFKEKAEYPILYPSQSLMEAVGRAATLLENILPHLGNCEKVHSVVTNPVRGNWSFSWLRCEEHAPNMKKLIAESVCSISLPWWCRRKNNEVAVESQARAMQRKMKILKHS
jgi:hypothetical protein